MVHQTFNHSLMLKPIITLFTFSYSEVTIEQHTANRMYITVHISIFYHPFTLAC